MENYVLECRNITKVYAGTTALDNVNFKIRRGHIHALVGENGAGKSTLASIISGLQKQTSGEIFVDGKLVNIKNVPHARSLGITIMTQEIDYCPNLSVAANIFLGQEKRKGAKLDWQFMNRETQKVLDRLGVDFKATDKAGYLSTSQKQQMQLARILYSKAKIIIMDEPTSSLNEQETNVLFKILKSLITDNMSIIYISHRMEEIFKIADMVTVLRDGKLIDTKPVSETTPKEVINMIVGKEHKFTRFGRTLPVDPQKVLEARNLTQKGQFADVSFSLKKGEVLGFFGLRGSGAESLIQALFGLNKVDAGEVYINEKKANLGINEAIANKIVFIPANRREEGILRTMNVRDNMVAGSLEDVSRFNVISFTKSSKKAKEMIQKLQVNCYGLNQLIIHLSGGNQQKVIVARSILMDAKIILINNPTRGIDVGAKVEIYRIIRELSEKGISVILVSSETTDILSVCDRVIVMRRGRLEAEFDADEMNDEKLLSAAMI